MTCLWPILTIILAYISNTLCASQFPIYKHSPKPTPYHDFDYLMYSQRWPVTACKEWKDKASANTCSMPPDTTHWIIHGVWPTKTGTEGPLYCPSAIHFDPGQLEAIIDDLHAHWTNIEANTKPASFWKHEWAKHGTCAAALPMLNSVTNYFRQGLMWNKQYDLTNILAESKIVPGSVGYTPEQIYDAVKSYTKTDPIIQCVVDKTTKDSMISEIRICFNNSLELIDCDHTNIRNSDTVLGNCNMKKPVMYLAETPVDEDSYAQKLHELYMFLKFLIWFTS